MDLFFVGCALVGQSVEENALDACSDECVRAVDEDAVLEGSAGKANLTDKD